MLFAPIDSALPGRRSTNQPAFSSDETGSWHVAQLSVTVAGVNNDPIPSDNPPGLVVLDPLLTGGTTAPQLLDGSDVLHILPATGSPGRVNVTIRPPGGATGDMIVIAGLDQTNEDLELDLVLYLALAEDLAR